MTKIKNTKKGMAKKTLSMSLVVAMLATSNVPVWAAEFSDGTDAVATESSVEAFSDNAETTPVVEDNNIDVAKDVEQINAKTTITGAGVNGTEIKYGTSITATTNETASDSKCYKLTYQFQNGSETTEVEAGTLEKGASGTLAATKNLTPEETNMGTLTYKIYEYTGTIAEANANSWTLIATNNYTVVGASADEYAVPSKDGKNASITITDKAEVGQTLTATLDSNYTILNSGTVAYRWYRNGEEITSVKTTSYNITSADLGCELTVKAYVSSGTTTYGDITLATSSVTVTSATAVSYIDSSRITATSNVPTWKDATDKKVGDLFTFDTGYINANATDIEKSLSIKKDGEPYALKGTDADKGAVIYPKITFTVPGIATPFTYEVTDKFVTVADISQNEITKIALADMQWKDSADGNLLERGKMPEYTYKNSSKESYHPVLAKVWIGQKEYNIGDQNVEATYTYNPDSITGLSGAVETCTVTVTLKIGSLTGKTSQEYKVKAVSFKETDITWPTSLTYAPAKELNEAATNATSVSGLTKYDGDNADTAQYKVEVTTGTDKAIVTVTGMNEYAGTSFQKEVAIAKYNIANAYVEPIDDQPYTGGNVEPKFTVKYNTANGSEFKSDTDYTFVYQKNRDAGTASIVITGTGMCEGTKIVTFNIVSKTFNDDIKNAFDTELKKTITYDAKEQKPLDKDLGGLKYLSDFSTSYVNNVDAGTATVTVKGVGNYAGATYTKTFIIEQKELSAIPAKDITIADTTYSKDLDDIDAYGKTVKPAVTVKFNGTTLRQGIDYDVKYEQGSKTPGSRTVKVTLKATDAKNSNFKATTDSEFAGKVISKELSSVTIPSIPSQVYNNAAYTLDNIKLSDGTLFKAGIKDGKNPLTLDKDYYVSAYKNNKETGTATILLAGKGDYKGTVTVTFPIDAQEMNAKFVYSEGNSSDVTDFDGVPDLEYNYNAAESKDGITHAKSNKTFRIVLTADSGSDKKGTTVDSKKYTIKYTENKAVGTATIEAVGKDGYSLNAKTTFKITPQAITDIAGSVTVASDILYYTGEEQKPKVTVDKTVDGHKLVEGTDYEVTYTDNIAANTDVNSTKAKFVIKGLGNYVIGTTDDKAAKNEGYSQEFTINKADIVNSNVTVKDVQYAGGLQVTPDVTIVNPYSGKELVQGTDYTVSLKADNTTEVGTSTVEVALTAAGKENYTISGNATGTMKFNFNITAKDLSTVTVAPIADQVATGEQIKPAITVTNGNAKLVEGKDYEVTYGKNKEVGEGTVTIKALDSNKNYTGSQTVKFNIVKETPAVGQAMISNVVVKGNTVTPVLSGNVDGAMGYDFVLATEENTTDGRIDISKNILKTNTDFYYVQEGTYYAYCHAWKRDENGKKVFGAWSNLYKFEVTATTPSTPKITSVKASGSTVTVTYTKSSDATGYDVILGTSTKKVNGETRPVNYGTLVKKNVKGNTVTVTFKNVPAGKYYAGLHSFNRTSENGSKVFSKWSNTKAVTVK